MPEIFFREFNDRVTSLQLVGYSISLGAFAVYSRLKMKEKQR